MQRTQELAPHLCDPSNSPSTRYPRLEFHVKLMPTCSAKRIDVLPFVSCNVDCLPIRPSRIHPNWFQLHPSPPSYRFHGSKRVCWKREFHQLDNQPHKFRMLDRNYHLSAQYRLQWSKKNNNQHILLLRKNRGK